MTRIEMRRRAYGWTQADLADRVRVARPNITMIERRRMLPWPAIRIRLAEVLRTDETELFDVTGWPLEVVINE